MLRNLKEIHRAQEDWARSVAVLDRLVILQPEAWAERRDRGLALAELGQTQRAVADLDTYLAHAEDALDTDAIAQRRDELRRAMS
jgi:regulator of sirC expression with transglutaminase-like and TPR domain